MLKWHHGQPKWSQDDIRSQAIHLQGMDCLTWPRELPFPLYSLFPFDFQIVAKKYRDFEFPSEMTGIWRYLNNAYARDEFTNTCPADQEIEHAYSDAARRMKWCWVASCLFQQLSERGFRENLLCTFPETAPAKCHCRMLSLAICLLIPPSRLC